MGTIAGCHANEPRNRDCEAKIPSTLDPPLTKLPQLDAQLRTCGFAVLDAVSLAQMLGTSVVALDAWHVHWTNLPHDVHLRDGGRYRRRRHASFVVMNEHVERAPDRPHWQPVEYNALHGGIERTFEPMDIGWTREPLWRKLLVVFAERASRLRGAQPWYVEAHPFRIDTAGGIGRPTPEGAHRDGVDLVVVILVSRDGIKGGETRVFEADAQTGMRFTMSEPWTALVLDDQRMIHESTPIQPLGSAIGHRDTLVLTFRASGFQGPEESSSA